jgi:hypothetical protein
MGREIHTKCCFESPNGKHHLENIGVDGRIILKWFLEKESAKICTGFFWLRIGTIGGLL